MAKFQHKLPHGKNSINLLTIGNFRREQKRRQVSFDNSDEGGDYDDEGGVDDDAGVGGDMRCVQYIKLLLPHQMLFRKFA